MMRIIAIRTKAAAMRQCRSSSVKNAENGETSGVSGQRKLY